MNSQEVQYKKYFVVGGVYKKRTHSTYNVLLGVREMIVMAWIIFVMGILKLGIFLIQIFIPGAHIKPGNLPHVILDLTFFILSTIIAGMIIFK